MTGDETLRAFLKLTEKGRSPALFIAKKGSAKLQAEALYALLPNAALLDAEVISQQEAELFFSKRIQQDGVLVFLLTRRTPLFAVGALNTLMRQNRVKISTPSGWETLSPHPKFKIMVVAEEDGLAQYQGLIRRTDFPYRMREEIPQAQE